MPQAKENEHSAQTIAKKKEQETLAGPPPKGVGRECSICGDRLWKRAFYPHMDEHLDFMNADIEEIGDFEEPSLEGSPAKSLTS